MSDRRDSLLATARYIDVVNRVITSTPGRQVGTVGRVRACPGAPNVIPGKVIFTVEIRDLNQAKVEALAARVTLGVTTQRAQELASRQSVTGPLSSRACHRVLA